MANERAPTFYVYAVVAVTKEAGLEGDRTTHVLATDAREAIKKFEEKFETIRIVEVNCSDRPVEIL